LEEQIEASSGKLRRTEEKIFNLDKEIQGKFEEKEKLNKQISDSKKTFRNSKTQSSRLKKGWKTTGRRFSRMRKESLPLKRGWQKYNRSSDNSPRTLSRSWIKTRGIRFLSDPAGGAGRSNKTLISEVVIALEGKKDLLLDRASSGSSVGVEDIAQALEGIIDKARGITAKFEQYKMNNSKLSGGVPLPRRYPHPKA
jgi:hypothetical protein